jgi:hypothetical protein
MTTASLLDDPIAHDAPSVSASWASRSPWLVPLGRGRFRLRAAERAADEIDLLAETYLSAANRRTELEPLVASPPLARPSWSSIKRDLLQPEREAWERAKDRLRDDEALALGERVELYVVDRARHARALWHLRAWQPAFAEA